MKSDRDEIFVDLARQRKICADIVYKALKDSNLYKLDLLIKQIEGAPIPDEDRRQTDNI